jgi:hypothetical protein
LLFAVKTPELLQLVSIEIARRNRPDRMVPNRLRPHSGRGSTTVEYATLEWIDWFNHRRLLEPIGDVPPAEFGAAWPSNPSYADGPTEPSLR